jgi:hypothetical protein
MLQTPERNAVVSLTADNGVRISGRFHHSMAGHWSIDLTEQDLLSVNAGSLVELQVMAGAELYVCQAQVAAVNLVSQALVLANIEQSFSRALRANERVSAAFA